MNPAPPVTRSRIARRLVAQGGKAGAKAVAPVRQLGRARTLAPQDRVRGTRGGACELRGRDTPHPNLELGLLEDRLRELGPAARAGGREVPDTRLRARIHELADRRSEMGDVRRRAALVVDDRDLVPLGAEPEHRPQEVVSGGAEEPGAPHDPRSAT